MLATSQRNSNMWALYSPTVLFSFVNIVLTPGLKNSILFWKKQQSLRSGRLLGISIMPWKNAKGPECKSLCVSSTDWNETIKNTWILPPFAVSHCLSYHKVTHKNHSKLAHPEMWPNNPISKIGQVTKNTSLKTYQWHVCATLCVHITCHHMSSMAWLSYHPVSQSVSLI